MTILITISKGLIARNLLQNNFYELVKQHFSTVVILTTAAADPRFRAEFAADNVLILPLPNAPDSLFRKLLGNIGRYIIYNGRTEMLGKHNFDRNRETRFVYWYSKYLFFKVIFKPLSKIKVLRKVLRKVDYAFLQHETVREYRSLIQKYQPQVVLATNITDDTEAAFLKAARFEKVPSIGMVKSWDNFSKKYFSARADKLAVWNQFMAKQAQALQDYKANEVAVIGVPQFDYYIDSSRLLSREEFCKKTGLNPTKKIIFFGSEGKLMPTDPNIIEVIRDFIINGELASDCQVLIRPHFAYTNDREKFKIFKNSSEVIIDSLPAFSSGFSDSWDYSREQMDHFLNSIYHSAMVINTASTLTADAIALNRPVILIQFEGYEKKSKYEAVAGWYTSDYYREVVVFKAALAADSVNSLKSAINSCLQDPDVLRAEREKFKQYFCLAVDGQAGKRLFNVVHDMVNRT